MPRQYFPKNFLRRAPNKLFRQYLAQHDIVADIAWDELREIDIQPILDAIDKAPPKVQKETDTDFREIFKVADQSGVRTIIEEGRNHKPSIDLAPTFEKIGGFLERSFWTFLNHKSICDVARKFDYADTLIFE